MRSTSGLNVGLSLAGSFAFGLSGGLAAIRKRLDLFGVAVVSVVAALTGGVVRDLLVGVPPQGFRDWRYLATAGAAGMLCFAFRNLIERLERGVQVLDALGLSLFCVTGTSAALVHAVPSFQAALLGAVTGVGGGILRDLLLGEVPAVLRRGLYAVPALAGATVVAGAHQAGSSASAFEGLGAAVCFALWVLGQVRSVELRIGGLFFPQVRRRQGPRSRAEPSVPTGLDEDCPSPESFVYKERR
jgi:uncharacterized membrane protein YeiH